MGQNDRAPDLGAMLNGLLSNPAALATLTSLLGNMGGGGAPPPGGGCPGEGPRGPECPKAPPLLPPSPPPSPAPPPPAPPCRGGNDRARLLEALRPYLSPARCDMMDSLLRILELMELLRHRR